MGGSFRSATDSALRNFPAGREARWWWPRLRRDAAEECSMARGGARNRSGPPPDPTSARSDARGLSFLSLPAAGFDGPAPAFPLPPRVVMRWVIEGKERWQERDAPATLAVAEREADLWAWAWRTPQAHAWAMPSESWRLHTVAMWVRTHVLCESGDATAADRGSLHRFADQIGMTPAGLKENGWAIKADDLAERREPEVLVESDELAARRRAIGGA